MTTFLITGASGFFGNSLLQALQKSKANGRFICLYNSQKNEINDPRFTWVKANLLDPSTHREVMKKFHPTYCVHLAWHVPPQNFWHAPENLEWLQASIHLFKEFCEAGGKVFMGAGSLAEYDWSSGILDEETTPLIPRSLYGQCKKSLYEILKVIRDTNYQSTTLLWPRIGYFFGQNEPPQKLISKVINRIKTGGALNLVSKDMKRPYAHVKYLGESLAYVLLNQQEDLAFNLSASHSYTLEEIIKFVGNIFDASPQNIVYDSYHTRSLTPEPLVLSVHTDLLRKALGNPIADTFFEDLQEMAQSSTRVS